MWMNEWIYDQIMIEYELRAVLSSVEDIVAGTVK